MLNLLCRRFDTQLYSNQTHQSFAGLKIHERVDYVTEMPYVFTTSKINLNISVKGIQSGMPQRVIDVMASGGFLLSNYRPALVEYFECGEEMDVYTSIEDAVLK